MQKPYPEAAEIVTLAVKAGDIISKNFDQITHSSMKTDGSIVTEVDHEINQMIVNWLTERYPSLSIMGEEGGRLIEDAEYTAFFDPLDGTLPFWCGIPVGTFIFSVVRQSDQAPVVAVINNPFTKTVWWAEKGKGAFRNRTNPNRVPYSATHLAEIYAKPTRCQVSSHSTIAGATSSILGWNRSYPVDHIRGELSQRGMGWMAGAAVGYIGGLLASGKIDVSIFPGTHSWETPAMQLLAEESGGRATDILGNPLEYGPKGDKVKGHIISNGKIHDEIVEISRRLNNTNGTHGLRPFDL